MTEKINVYTTVVVETFETRRERHETVRAMSRLVLIPDENSRRGFFRGETRRDETRRDGLERHY